MKCENCGKNEVSFVYRSNINGKLEEKHLCADCAEKLGYTEKVNQMAARSQNMMKNLFQESFFGNSLLGGFEDEFFRPETSLLGRMNHFFEDPFDDFFETMPALPGTPAKEQERQEEKEQGSVAEQEESRFSKMRHLNALKLEMKKAIHK